MADAQPPWRVVVTSTNPAKIEAVRLGFAALCPDRAVEVTVAPGMFLRRTDAASRRLCRRR